MRLLLILLTSLCLGCGTSTEVKPPPSIKVEIIKGEKPAKTPINMTSVVTIGLTHDFQTSAGTGVVIKGDRILSCAHVEVMGMSSKYPDHPARWAFLFFRQNDRFQYQAVPVTLEKMDKNLDLVIYKFERPEWFKPEIELADSFKSQPMGIRWLRCLHKQQPYWAVGKTWIIDGFIRMSSKEHGFNGCSYGKVVSDDQIIKGDSGSPFFGLDGKLIGIACVGSRHVLGLVTIERIRTFLEG